MAHTGLIWGCEEVNLDLLANSRMASPIVSGAALGGSYYAFSNGIRGSHMLRTGAAMIAGSALSCLYMFGRPIFFDNLFSTKKKPRY